MANNSPSRRLDINVVAEIYMSNSLRQTAKLLGRDQHHVKNILIAAGYMRPQGRPIRYLTPELRAWKKQKEDAEQEQLNA